MLDVAKARQFRRDRHTSVVNRQSGKTWDVLRNAAFTFDE